MVVQGASGGVGTLLARWAKLIGATVIATVGSENKARIVESWGLDYVLRSDEPELAERMPIALYTIKDSSISAIFVIFICSVWPMLINTAFGVAAVRKDWLNVARTLEVSPLRKAFILVLPAAAPTIITGMRISMGMLLDLLFATLQKKVTYAE